MSAEMNEQDQPANRVQPLRWRRIALAYLIGGLLIGGLQLGVRLAFAVPSPTGATEFNPGLAVESRSHDFGPVLEGFQLRHEFTIRNKGTSRVILHSTEGECCGEGDSEQWVVPAGGVLQIPVLLDTTGKQGTLRTIVPLTTSDPKQPRIELQLIAHVRKHR